MVVKIDMENTFNVVHHSFLFKIIHRFCFEKQFNHWIKSYIDHPCIAPLINDQLSPNFQFFKGMRQGLCSPSCYVFLWWILLSNNLRKRGYDARAFSLNSRFHCSSRPSVLTLVQGRHIIVNICFSYVLRVSLEEKSHVIECDLVAYFEQDFRSLLSHYRICKDHRRIQWI